MKTRYRWASRLDELTCERCRELDQKEMSSSEMVALQKSHVCENLEFGDVPCRCRPVPIAVIPRTPKEIQAEDLAAELVREIADIDVTKRSAVPEMKRYDQRALDGGFWKEWIAIVGHQEDQNRKPEDVIGQWDLSKTQPEP